MTSRERILNAAIPVFARKGRFGAHMEDIAALAHINKAMIYYIFHSKDELYLEVLKLVLAEANRLNSIFNLDELNGENDYVKLLRNYISVQISFFAENTYYTKIIVDAISSGAEEIPIAVKYYRDSNSGIQPPEQLRVLIEKGKSEKIFRNIDTDQFIISIIGMVMIYFFSGNLSEFLNISIKDEKKFLEERKESIIDLILNSILIKNKKNK